MIVRDTVLSLLFFAGLISSALAQSTGVLPVGADGKPLNLDFEQGTLKDWTVDGEAFEGQPIKGEIDQNRQFGSGKKSDKQGEYWIGGFEKKFDKPHGTLTSLPFKVTHPYAAFQIGGGSHAETRVELVLKDSGQVFFKASGVNIENMIPVAVDLRPQQGKEIFIRIVDQHSGGWGHVNFDNFRFYDAKPAFPKQPGTPGPTDAYDFAGLSPERAAEVMTLPPGFKATLFAGEPDVKQPIAMAIDDRGRLWIAEAYSYPRRVPDAEAKDRILIFEDVDGDGKFDKRTVFTEKLNLVSGIEVGFGGVWVGAAPYFMFIPDADGDDRPDGPPQILLDGWGYQDTHETLNSFIWGPDGWLYGCHGVFTHSRVGKPGTPDADRVPINAGIWRYHPVRHEFEVFAHGTSNPWGVDFNDHGQAFLTACVIPHLYHVIQGARYERQSGQHFNPYTYDDIKTIADHRHYLGATPHGGNNRSDEAGGGHAHAGAMIYLGGAWPEKYRNQIFMNNIHGQRINMDILKPHGSGYIGSHGDDFLLTNDRWSQILNLRYGPDGNVYMIDWYDNQACHHGDAAKHDRSNGRIFKISYEGAPNVTGVDLATKSDVELAELMLHPNDWYVRHARRLLQERAAKRKVDAEAVAALTKIAKGHADDTRRLRGMWALHLAGMLDDDAIIEAMQDKSAYVRGWAIQLMEQMALPPSHTPRSYNLKGLAIQINDLIDNGKSPVVRLYLASHLQREPSKSRLWPLTGRDEADASDHNLPYMYWYALESLADDHMADALEVAMDARIPKLLANTVRKIGSLGTPDAIETLIHALGEQETTEKQLAILEGLNKAFAGRRQVQAPPSWSATYAALASVDHPQIRSQLKTLAVTFGDASALGAMRAVVVDAKAQASLRNEALASLIKARDPNLPPVLRDLLRDTAMRGGALRGLAAYEDSQTAPAILAIYSSLTPDEKRDALATLCSRSAYAKTLLAAIGGKQIPNELSADLARQLRGFNDAEITKHLNEVWGTVRETAADKAKLIADYKKLLESKPATPPDLAAGRAIFAKTCQQCHTLFGTGGKVGPDITGSNRANLDYLLSNVVDPSAVMAKEYIPSVILTQDGRLVTGIVKAQDKNALTVQTPNELLVLPRGEIDTIEQGTKSMMPDDLLKPLDEQAVRNLVAYLASPKQAPLLVTKDNVAGFFNGKDLAGWLGDAELWSVEQGEIVGRTSGLKRNEFLKSDLLLGDFKLTVDVKLVRNEGNSGIQFRSEALADGEVKGYQADVGVGWWGKLYEERGRGLLWNKSGEAHVKSGEWNTYEITAVGSRLRTTINGQPCVDLDDPTGARRGIIAFQLHSGGPTEVRFKNLRLELDPTPSPSP
jgi:putative membrane-bound dehydrogenase-like protein